MMYDSGSTESFKHNKNSCFLFCLICMMVLRDDLTTITFCLGHHKMAYVGTIVVKGNTYTQTLSARVELNFGALGAIHQIMES